MNSYWKKNRQRAIRQILFTYPLHLSLRGLYEVNAIGEILLTARFIKDDTLIKTIEVPPFTNEEHVVKYLKRKLLAALKGMNN